MSATVTTVFISEEAVNLLILEQSERNDLKALCDRLVTKRRELKRIQRESEELEQEVISKVKSMDIKGITL